MHFPWACGGCSRGLGRDAKRHVANSVRSARRKGVLICKWRRPAHFVNLKPFVQYLICEFHRTCKTHKGSRVACANVHSHGLKPKTTLVTALHRRRTFPVIVGLCILHGQLFLVSVGQGDSDFSHWPLRGSNLNLSSARKGFQRKIDIYIYRDAGTLKLSFLASAKHLSFTGRLLRGCRIGPLLDALQFGRAPSLLYSVS